MTSASARQNHLLNITSTPYIVGESPQTAILFHGASILPHPAGRCQSLAAGIHVKFQSIRYSSECPLKGREK